MPYSSFCKVASVLDDKRLGKQRVEALQILKAILDPTYGWQSHPAVHMWRGSAFYLVRYGIAMCQEWKRRGFQDTVEEQLRTIQIPFPSEFTFPTWTRDKWLQQSHRSNLVKKDKEHYGPIWPSAKTFFPYIWPKSNTDRRDNPKLVEPVHGLDGISNNVRKLQVCNNGETKKRWKGNTLIIVRRAQHASGNSRLDRNSSACNTSPLAH